MQQMIPVFLTVFLAELGDKTQLATLLFASDREREPWMVFLASAAALVVAAAIGVACGAAAGCWGVSPMRTSSAPRSLP